MGEQVGCTSCALTTAMMKAVKLSDKPSEIVDQIINAFLDGHKTFKETCLELGLNEQQMESVLEKEHWNSTMK